MSRYTSRAGAIQPPLREHSRIVTDRRTAPEFDKVLAAYRIEIAGGPGLRP